MNPQRLTIGHTEQGLTYHHIFSDLCICSTIFGAASRTSSFIVQHLKYCELSQVKQLYNLKWVYYDLSVGKSSFDKKNILHDIINI